MHIEDYYSPKQDDTVTFTREQASQFAKRVADDFNPIHDVDAKRFCVPGDLLFTVALFKLGLKQTIEVNFSDMVSDGVALRLEESSSSQVNVVDEQGKQYLSFSCSGDSCHDAEKINALSRSYVAFSGTTFPHVLVPLWAEQQVMVNPARPLVIYESMSIRLDHFDFAEPELRLLNPTLEVNGKRGNVVLPFSIVDGEKTLGSGEKRMVISGLKPYDQAAIDDLIAFYEDRKQRLK